MNIKTKTKAQITKPLDRVSAVNEDQFQIDQQEVYLVTCTVILPRISTTGGVEIVKEQRVVDFTFIMHSAPTVDSLTVAFDNHPMLTNDARHKELRPLFLAGLRTWGIPEFSQNFGSVELFTVIRHWNASGVQKNGSVLLDQDFGLIAVTKKIIV